MRQALLSLSVVLISVCSVAQVNEREQAAPTPERDRAAWMEGTHAEDSDYMQLQRQKWFLEQRAFPGKRIPPGARHRALEQKRLLPRMDFRDAVPRAGFASMALMPGQWTQIGPQPSNGYWGVSAGRATAVIFDPRNNKVAYAGMAGGGVWKTTDGVSWFPIADFEPSLAIGSIALDPANPNVVYVGTGEQNYSGDSYYGEGILKSTNGGGSWTAVRGPFALSQVGSIAVSPSNSSIVLAGALGFTSTMWPGAIWRSADGGATWTSVLTGNADSIVFDPTNGSIAYAGLGNWGDPFSGIYKSTDSGVHWTKLTTDLPPGPSTGRIGLAIDPTHPATLYAAIADRLGGSGYAGIYKTTNSGANWTKVYPSGTDAPNCCSWYENGIAVDRANPKVIVAGGFGIVRSVDGGTTWTDISGTHPDQHAFAFSPDSSVLYAANDGGLWQLPNPGGSTIAWSSMNSTIATITFYPGLGMDPGNLTHALAGTQDNGAENYAGVLGWTDTAPCGDASSALIDPTNSANKYVYCIGTIYRWAHGGWESTSFGLNPNDPGGWVSPLAMDPASPGIIYYGARAVYQSTNYAASWLAISPSLDGQLINSLAVAPSKTTTMYAGMSDGKVFMTTNAGVGATWNSVSTGLPNHGITSIAVSNSSPTTAYLTESGFDVGHVWKTTNGGTSWTDISGNLPNAPANCVVIDPDLSNVLYVATDVGVFMTTNGSTWSVLGSGLPEVVVQSIAMHQSTRTLRAITHGRSAWDLYVPKVGTVALSPESVKFGNTMAGGGKSVLTISAQNAGETSVSLGSTTISGANVPAFAVSSTTCGSTLTPSASCTYNVTFVPHTVGVLTASLALSTGGTSPAPVALQGNATLTPSPTILAYGNVTVGGSATLTVTLANKGVAGVTLRPLKIAGTNAADFMLRSTTCGSSLAAGASCAATVTFTPALNTFRSASLQIAQAGMSGVYLSQGIILKGTGTLLTMSPASLTFASRTVGTTSAAKVVTVLNTSTTTAVGISKVGYAGANPADFLTTSNTCGTSLAPGASCVVNVAFKPTAKGTRTALLAVTNNGGGTTETISLTGTGQ